MKFPTECFYLTMQTLHVSIASAVGHLKTLKRNLLEVDAGVNELQKQLDRLEALMLRERVMLESKLHQAKLIRRVHFVYHLPVSFVYCLESATIFHGKVGSFSLNQFLSGPDIGFLKYRCLVQSAFAIAVGTVN